MAPVADEHAAEKDQPDYRAGGEQRRPERCNGRRDECYGGMGERTEIDLLQTHGIREWPHDPEREDEGSGQERKWQPAGHRDGEGSDQCRQNRHPAPQRHARMKEVRERQSHEPGIEPV